MQHEHEEVLVIRSTPDRVWIAGGAMALVGGVGLGLFLWSGATLGGPWLVVLFVLGVTGAALVAATPPVTARLDRQKRLLTWQSKPLGQPRIEHAVLAGFAGLLHLVLKLTW